MELLTVRLEKPEAVNVILGQSHFIKTVEDVHEALVTSVPGIKFGLAFCESSGPALVRVSGTDDVNLSIVQPLLFLQMGKGSYLRSSGAMTFDIENSQYYIPVGFGIGKVVKSGRSVFNMWLEPQFTILHDGEGYPAFQVFAGLNLQLLSAP